MNSLNYFGLSITSAGMVSPPDNSYEVITSKNNDNYKKLILKNGLITGLIFAGDIETSGIINGLMKDRVNVNDYKETLVADNFNFVSLAETVWPSEIQA